MRSAGEQAKVARMLRRRRMMQKFRGIAFHDSIDIVYTKLALIHEEPISWRFAFEKRHGPFDSPNPADERSDQQRDNTEMRDEKREVMFTPWPARKRGGGQVGPEQDKPNIEPRRPVDISARNLRIESRFVDGACDRRDDQHRQQNDRKLKRCKKFENRVALPGGLPG